MKKILATSMAFALAFSICCTTAFAADNSVTVSTAADTMTFETVLNMSADAVTAPATTFEYNIAYGTGETFDDATTIFGRSCTPTTATTEGGLPDITGVLVSDADYDTSMILAQDSQDTNNYFTVESTVDFSSVSWEAPGIYHFVITATSNDDSGIIMDSDASRDVYVYVVYDTSDSANGDDLVISNIIMTTNGLTSTTVTDEAADTTSEDTEKSSGFTNSYGVDPTDPGSSTPTDPTDPGDPGDAASEDFIVDLYVEGNMADRNQDFTVTLTNTSNVVSGIADGTIFKIEDADDAISYVMYTETEGFQVGTIETEEGTTSFDVSDLATAEFLLHNSESFTILSVVGDMKFEATITDENNYTIYSGEYAETYESETLPGTGGGEDLDFANIVVDTDTDDEGITFEPNYDQSIPDTGVLIDFLPFVLIVLISAGIIVLRVSTSGRKRAK